jgi:hypothetical protein
MNDYVVTDVYSTEMGIRLSFVKSLEFRGRGDGFEPPRYASDRRLSYLVALDGALLPLTHFCTHAPQEARKGNFVSY